MDMEEEESDYESSRFWREKHDNALSALESCERSKQLLEKQNEELRRRSDETRSRCENLTTKINVLTEKFRKVEQDRDILRGSKNQLSQILANKESELSTEREKTMLFEQKLEEKEAAIKQLIEEEKCFTDVYDKIVLKSKALEEFGSELITAKEQLQTKIAEYETRIMNKDIEIKQLEEQMKLQSAEFDDLQKVVADIVGELSSLKTALEENRQKKEEFSRSLIDLRQRFEKKNEKIAKECYSQALQLEKAYKDCEVYCKKIEDLEKKLADTRKHHITKEISLTEDELKPLNELAATKRMTELENQISSYRQEIQNLRVLVTEERLARLDIEKQYEKKYTECSENLREVDQLKTEVEGLTKALNAKMEGNGGKEQSIMEFKRELTQILGETGDPKHKVGKMKSETGVKDGAANDDYKLQQELTKLRSECILLADKNEELRAENAWLSSLHEHRRRESLGLKSDMESLKQHVLKIEENAVTDMADDNEDIEKLKIHCAALREEKAVLLKVVDELKEEQCNLTKGIADLKQSQWKIKREKTMPHAMTDGLDRTTAESRFDKEFMMRKIEEMEKDHKQILADVEKQWLATLAEKENFYEKRLEARGTNDVKVRQLEEELSHKESQLQIKKGEVKRILIKYSDLRNEKFRCETKLESLQGAERTLTARIEKLESKVTQLEQKERELIKKLEEKEIEKMKLNEDWRRAALDSVNELKKAMSE